MCKITARLAGIALLFLLPSLAGAETSKSGYTVTVELSVGPEGRVQEGKVVASDLEELNDFALAMAEGAELGPEALPPPGAAHRRIQLPFHFPLPKHREAKPLPEGVVMPTVRLQFSPVYPYECRSRGITGGVWLSLTIGKNGQVKSCKVIEASHPKFAPVAEQAVARWQFRPATLAGKPVEVAVNVAFSFEIEGKPREWRWLLAPAPSLLPFRVVTRPE